jgi:hypothetical protein
MFLSRSRNLFHSLSVSIWKLALNLLCVLMLGFASTSCAFNSDPPRSLVIEALQAQIAVTQASISESLGLNSSINVPTVSRVRVDHQETLKVDGQRITHLEGSFDWQLPQDPVRVDSTFELFLLKGQYGEGWTLARPIAGDADDLQHWILYPLGLPEA